MGNSEIVTAVNTKKNNNNCSYKNSYSIAYYNYFQGRDYENAIKYLDKSIEENIDDYEYFCKSYNLKCLSYNCLKKYNNALETIDEFIFNKDINLSINDATYYHKARSLFNLNKFEDALKNINLAISIEYKSSFICDLKVNILYKLNMLETNINEIPEKFYFSKMYAYELIDDWEKSLDIFKTKIVPLNKNFYDYVMATKIVEKELDHKFEEQLYKLCRLVVRLKNKQLYNGSYKVIVSQYTHIDNISMIFSNSENKSIKFRMNNAVHMNDPQEGMVLQNYFKQENSDNSRDILENLYPESELGEISNTFLTSFSLADEFLPMWNTYANNSNGCRIEIPTFLFDNIDIHNSMIDSSNTDSEDSKINIGEKYCLYKVIYLNKDNNKLVINDKDIKDIVDNIALVVANIEKLILNVSDDEKKQILNITRDVLDGIRFLFKSYEYEYENEVRIIKLCSDSNKVGFSESVDLISRVPKLYIELEKDIPYEEVSITLGAKVQKPKEVANYLKHIGVKKVTKSKMPYQ